MNPKNLKWIVAVCGLSVVFCLAVNKAEPQTCAVPPENLVGWWPGDGTAEDLVGENDGEAYHGASWGPGLAGLAFHFDGYDDLVLVPNSDDLDFGDSEDFSIDAWINLQNPTPGHDDEIVIKMLHSPQGFSNGYSFRVYRDSRLLVFIFILDGGNTSHYLWSNSSIPLNQWVHVAAVREGNTGFLYIDGQLDASGQMPTDSVANNADLSIGGIHDTRWNPPVQEYHVFGGLIDELEIVERALTPGEILAIVNAGSLGKCKAPLLTCAGFHPPMAAGTVTARGNRALPLKAELFDGDGYEMTDLELTAPPVLQVYFTPAGGGEAIDVTGDALPVGLGTEGNEFEYNLVDGVWQYNLKTSDHTAAGTYTIIMVSGDESEYIVDPTCEAAFERQE